MAQDNDPLQKAPPAPRPIAPREQAVVDGRAVTFEWEPVETARAYRLEVAADTAFDEIVFERNVGRETSLTVTDTFPTDGRTFYWHVLAENAAGWSTGDLVESFISNDVPSGKATGLPEEEEEQEGGPAGELIRSVAREAKAETTGKPEHYEREAAQEGVVHTGVEAEEGVDVGVQHEGVEAGQVLGLALAILAALIFVIIVVFIWVDTVAQEVETQAAGISLQLPEQVRLQEEAAQQLNQYGVIDEAEGIYQIPIERAMELVVQEAAREGGQVLSPEMIPYRPGAGAEAAPSDTLDAP